MTRDEAVAALRECKCKRWITTPTCDHCWVDAHQCPPTPERAIAMLNRAMELGTEARALASKLNLASRS